MDYVGIGKRIKHMRTEAGLTQRELANLVGVSLSHMGRLELGKEKTSLDTMVAIANTLNTHLDYLMGIPMQESMDLCLFARRLTQRQRKALLEMIAVIESCYGDKVRF